MGCLLSALFAFGPAASHALETQDTVDKNPLVQDKSNLNAAKLFHKLPEFAAPVISPLRDKIAFQTVYKGQVLLVNRTLGKDGKAFNGKLSAIKAGDFSVQDYVWANNERLIVQVRTFLSNWDEHTSGALLIAINFDGSDSLSLPMAPDLYIRSRYGRNVFLPHPRVIEPLINDREHVLAELDIALTQGFFVFPKVHKVNIYTGKKTLADKNKKNFWRWFADKEGNLRIGERVDFASASRFARLYHSQSDNSEWELQQKQNNNSPERLYPYRMAKENSDILLVHKSESVDYYNYRFVEDNLLKYDTAKKTIIGPYVNSFRKEAIEFSKQQFPGRQVDVNSMDWNEEKAIVKIYSDIEPPVYFIYQRAEKRLGFLSTGYPDLKSTALSEMQQLSYLARDGAKIMAYLTLPKQAVADSATVKDSDNHQAATQKPAAIILPHDGPTSRDWWGFDRYVQFFASMGYAVFQPQYRGSTGFGSDHKFAGDGQWGLRMQDDVNDGVKWLAASGKIDPDRICIVGSGYGGYVAALELAKNSDMYQCGVSINGILNFKKFIERFKYTSMVDTKDIFNKGYNEASEYSPTDLTADIDSPLLLIASEKNAVIDTDYSRLMNKRMKKKGKIVEYLELEGAEHWETNNQHELCKFTAMAEFFNKYLAPKPKQALAASQAN